MQSCFNIGWTLSYNCDIPQHKTDVDWTLDSNIPRIPLFLDMRRGAAQTADSAHQCRHQKGKKTGPLSEDLLILIDLFHGHAMLWDVRAANYKNRSCKDAAWTSLRQNFVESISPDSDSLGAVYYKPEVFLSFFNHLWHLAFKLGPLKYALSLLR